jgi:hypothetical protein
MAGPHQNGKTSAATIPGRLQTWHGSSVTGGASGSGLRFLPKQVPSAYLAGVRVHCKGAVGVA